MASGGAASDAMTEALMARRLEDAELEAVRETKEQVKKLKEVKGEYQKLKTTLERLPEEFTHDIMVPMGKKAFMPGKLVHTNEILVLLGENWFVETSASRASEIADRRLSRLDEIIAQTDKQRQMFENRNYFTKDVADSLRPDSDEKVIREEYVATDFAAIEDKKRRRATEARPESRRQLMERARKAMAKCQDEEQEHEGEEEEEERKRNGPTTSDDSLHSVLRLRHPSPLKERPHFREMPISDRDWEERLKTETENKELEKMIVNQDANEIVQRLMNHDDDNDNDDDDDDDERYDERRLTDDDDDDDDEEEEEEDKDGREDDVDVPYRNLGNLGRAVDRPPSIEEEVLFDRGYEDDNNEGDEEEEDVPIVAFGNVGKPKPQLSSSSSVVTPPNVSRTISLTGNYEDEDTPRTRERKRLTWAAGVEDNDAAKCDAFGSRLKALFNSYKDEEIVVSDEGEEEEEKDEKTIAVEVDTIRIFTKHTRAEEEKETASRCDEAPSSSSSSSSSSRQSPRHPGDIKASFSAASGSKTTFKEIGEKSRQSRLDGGASGDGVERSLTGVVTARGCVDSRETPPPIGAPSTPTEPKSILKKKGRKVVFPKFGMPEEEVGNADGDASRVTRSLKLEERSESPDLIERKKPSPTDAVAEEIKEREPTDSKDDKNLVRSSNGEATTIEASSTDSVIPKRVSKFKQQRQNRT